MADGMIPVNFKFISFMQHRYTHRGIKTHNPCVWEDVDNLKTMEMHSIVQGNKARSKQNSLPIK